MKEFGMKAQGLTSSSTHISLLDSEDEDNNNSMSDASIDVPITNKVESSEPEDSYTPFTSVMEMIVTPNNSDVSTSFSQYASKRNIFTTTDLTSNTNAKRKCFCQQERAREEES
eukprot:15113175-Ditylum_brightwellii.AAC.1